MSQLNKNNCLGVREVIPSPRMVPCGGNYYQTDCVFFSDGVLDGSMDLGANPTLSEFVSSLLYRMSDMEEEISSLRDEISELRNK